MQKPDLRPLRREYGSAGDISVFDTLSRETATWNQAVDDGWVCNHSAPPFSTYYSKKGQAMLAQKLGEQLIKELGPLYPAADLSFGYIGNWWTDGRPNPDDRLWSFYTRIQPPYDHRDIYHNPYSFGKVETPELFVLVLKAITDLEPWLRDKLKLPPL